MTLVETMVALGISATLSLGVMQAIDTANRAVKNTSLSGNWQNLINRLQLAMGNRDQCGHMVADLLPGSFAGNPLPPSTAGGDNVIATPSQITLNDNSGNDIITLLDLNETIGGFRADEIEVIVSPNNITQTIRVGIQDFLVDELQLSIVAIKADGAGNELQLPGVTRHESSWRNPQSSPITFHVVRDAGNNVVGCYGLHDAPQQACTEMGGVYYDTGPGTTTGNPTPRCRMPQMFFGSNTSTSSPTSTDGQRLQLWGLHGAPSSSDYALGIDNWTIWYNAGGAGNGRHRFYNNAGNTLLAEFDSAAIDLFPDVVAGNDLTVQGGLVVFDDSVLADNVIVGGSLSVFDSAYIWDNLEVWDNMEVQGRTTLGDNWTDVVTVNGVTEFNQDVTIWEPASQSRNGNVVHECWWTGGFTAFTGTTVGVHPDDFHMVQTCGGDIGWGAGSIADSSPDDTIIVDYNLDCHTNWGANPTPSVVGGIERRSRSQIIYNCTARDDDNGTNTGLTMTFRTMCCRY